MSRATGANKDDYAQLAADFRMLADSIPQLAWMTRPDGWIFWYNRRWFDYTGTTLEEMQGWGWRRVHHPDHVDRVVEKIQTSFETGEPWEDVFPLLGRDGEYRWFLSRALPIRDENGDIVRWFGTNTDVTEQKKAEERMALLMREIDHRAKNALAVAQAVVNLTQGNTIEEYKTAVEGRIAALSRAHTLLAASRWEGADLRALLEDELAPFATAQADRIVLEGENETLSPAVAQSLALVVHELATNAAKYGALSCDAGRLTIAWARAEDGLILDWRESGGPEVTAPLREGFGSTLLSRMAVDFEGGSIRREWAPEGLRCRIELKTSAENKEARLEGGVARRGGAKQAAGILVVEDEPLTALDIASRLRARGYPLAATVGSLEKAREAIASATPSLALLDGNLNGESSLPLAEELLEAGVPVVYCTGYEGLGQLPGKVASCPVVPKPVSDEALFGAVEKFLGRAGGESPA